MKIRQGFVSNSSSSSFIIACKGKKPPKGVLYIAIDLDQFVGECLATAEAVREYFLNRLYYTEKELSNEYRYRECLKEIEKGNVIYCGSASSDGDHNEQAVLNYGVSAFVFDEEVNIISDCDL